MQHDQQPRRTVARPPQNTVALGAGFGIGILWIIFAVMALSSSFRGYANDRYDWGLAWGLVGLLLLAAGLAAIIGTWWHQTRHASRWR
jgi:hypothetical protein